MSLRGGATLRHFHEDPTFWQKAWAFCKTLPRYAHVRPVSGNLAWDLIYLLVVMAIQRSFLPTTVSELFVFDLLTPWLTVSLVLLSPWRALVVGLIGALMIETHSMAPAGLYVASFWVMGVVLYLLRATLSWHHALPWMVTFACAQAWVGLMETLAILASPDQAAIDAAYCVFQLQRLCLGVAFGLFLVRRRISGLLPREA